MAGLILLTGASGYIGSRLLRVLEEGGCSIRCLSRQPSRVVTSRAGTYARRPDGRLDVVNRCQTGKGAIEARGVARIIDTQTFAKLQVRFAPAWLSVLPVVWGDYWIVGLAPDYSWAVVGSPDRDYLWILARTPRLEAGAFVAAQKAARTNGFEIERLIQQMPQAATPSTHQGASSASNY